MTYCQPVRNKKAAHIAESFQKILDAVAPVVPRSIMVDKGREFFADFKRLADSKGIHVIYTGGNHKSPGAENFIKHLKRLIYRYFTSKGTDQWYNVLDHLVNNMNTMYRSVLKARAIDVNRYNAHRFYDTLYGKYLQEAKVYKETHRPVFKPGDKVRILLIEDIFQKGYVRKYSEEIFTVTRVKKTVPFTYILLDPQTDDEITNAFYETELLLAEEELD